MKRFEPKHASDTDLLIRYQDGSEEGAFEELVRRHGGMVLTVGRRVLKNTHDAEDVFQATFCALAKSASDIREKEALAGWLHTAAFRCAAKLSRKNISWKEKTERAMEDSRVSGERLSRSEAETVVAHKEMLEVLDEELSCLPANYRAAVVLCDLEGKTQKEASKQLGIASSTLNEHVSKGRSRPFHNQLSFTLDSSVRPTILVTVEKKLSGSRLRAWQYAPVRGEQYAWPTQADASHYALFCLQVWR